MSTKQTIDKHLYRIALLMLKVLPLFCAGIYTIHPFCQYNHIDIDPIAHLAHLSFPIIILLYIFSYMFNFCLYYRITLLYITINESINTYNNFSRNTLSDKTLFTIHLILIIITIIIILIITTYYYVSNHKKNPVTSD